MPVRWFSWLRCCLPPSLNAPSSIPRDHRVQVRTDFPMCVLGFPHVCTCAVLNPDTHANPCLDHHFYRELSKARMNTLAPGSFGDQQNSSSPDKGETIGSRRGDSGHRQTLACPFTEHCPHVPVSHGKTGGQHKPTRSPSRWLSACCSALCQYRSRVLPAQLGLSMAYCYHSMCIRDRQDVAVSPNPRHVTLQIWAAPVHPWGNPVLLLRGGRGSDADSSSSD